VTQTKLQAGDTAPQFTAVDTDGNTVDLASYKGRHVMVVFLRYSGCPWCNLAIHRLTLESKLLERNGCKVIAFVQSAKDDVKANIYDRHTLKPPFPIIPDASMKFYEMYGVGTSLSAATRSIKDIPYWLKSVFEHGFKQTKFDGNMLVVPAMFLISKGDQKIIKAEYSSSFYEHQTFTDVYESLTFDAV